jgi:adenylate kinase
VLQEILDEIVDIDLVLNFKCADDCLMKKQSRSDVCSHCGQLFDASNSAYANCKPFLGNYSWHSQAEPSGVFGLGDSRMEKLRAYAKQVKFNMCQPSFTLNELGFLFVKKSHFLKLMS